MQVAPVTLELPGGAVRLEPLSIDHAPALFEASRDPDIWRFLPVSQPTTPEQVLEMICVARKEQDQGARLPFAVVDTRTGFAVGTTSYLDIQPSNRSLEIGWTWLGAAARRTAINTQCKYLLLRHAFDSLGAVRVCLKTDARNQRSQRAILRLGARYEGCLRRSRVLQSGYIRDTIHYSILDREWPGVKSRLELMLTR